MKFFSAPLFPFPGMACRRILIHSVWEGAKGIELSPCSSNFVGLSDIGIAATFYSLCSSSSSPVFHDGNDDEAAKVTDERLAAAAVAAAHPTVVAGGADNCLPCSFRGDKPTWAGGGPRKVLGQTGFLNPT